MPAARRSAYDSPAFRQMWYSDATLEDMAEKYGVSIVAIWRAAMRRGLNGKGK